MMVSKIAFYVFVYPISHLPLGILYFFTDIFYFFIYYLIGYRKKVIFQNLRNSFPEKSEREIKSIAQKFYRHFTDLLAEGVKNLSISQKQLLKRVKIEHPELLQRLYNENRSVLLVSGHYNNWELLITSQALLFPHQAVGIGKPLTSKFWDKKLNDLRARNGMRIINNRNVNEKLTEWKNESIAILSLSDQSPGDSFKSYWMEFLNQPTAVLFGTELLANEYDMAVVFFHMKKVKRGHYAIEMELITENPHKETYGFITESHTRKLEQIIREKPEYWLWSHKRWKREIPENLAELKAEQKKRFEQKYRSA